MIKDSNSKIHLIFLSILSLNYLIPIIIFGNITLFYHDVLDIGVVYNHILGKFYRGDLPSIDLFLNGELRKEFLPRLLHPLSYLYAILATETAYWITDVLIKLTSYISFFVLSKKINLSTFNGALLASLYAASNLPTTYAVGLAFFPYLICLVFFTDKIKINKLLLVIFFGLNTSIVHGIFIIPIIFIIYVILKQEIKKINLNCLIIYTSSFFLFSLIANANLIYAELFLGPFHRVEFERVPLSIPFFTHRFLEFFFLTNKIDHSSIYNLPYAILFIPTFIFSLFSKNQFIKKTLYILIAFYFFHLVLNINFIQELQKFLGGFFWTFNFTWYLSYKFLLISLFLAILFKYNKKNLSILVYFIIISLFAFQINSSLIPLYKTYSNKNVNYQNIYTFKGYYRYEDFKEIKKIVGSSRTMSIGIDPMVSVMNNIGVVDGYHTLYTLKYKLKFRKIIEKELDKNNELKKYYDIWGNRVYAFINDQNKIDINFLEAQKMGVNFIISKYQINNISLELIKEVNNKNPIYLYKIK